MKRRLVLAFTHLAALAAGVALGVYFLLHLVEGNVLVPLVMRNTVGLSPFLVLLSLLLGGTVGGILGAVVAVPIVAGITVILERLQDREVPVPIDPAAVETPSPEEKEAHEAHSPDSPASTRRKDRATATAKG